MKLIQKIVSHGLLIAFIVAAFFIYTNRMELFPQWFARSAPATAGHSQVKTKSPAIAAKQKSRPDVIKEKQAPVSVKPDTAVSEPVVETPAAASEDKQVQASAAAVQSTGVQEHPANDEPEPVFRPLTETEPVEVTDAVSGDKTGSQETEVINAPPEEEVVAATGQAATGQDVAAASDFQQRLELARAHFWQRDIRAALQTYQSLAESYPERAEVRGELGNLYFNIGRVPDAMNSYAHAVELLIEQGDAVRARELLNVMYRLDARRASQFEMHLRQTGG